MAELTYFEKKRGLWWIWAANSACTISFLAAMSGSVVILFFSELGFDSARIGLLISLISLCGLSSLFTAPYVARFGFKRMYLIFFGVRIFFMTMVLLTIIVPAQFMFQWIVLIIVLFSLSKAISDTAWNPWSQEAIPDSIRGKFYAIDSNICQLTSVSTLVVSGYIIRNYSGINRFMIIIAGGAAAGWLALWLYSMVPGGKPIHTPGTQRAHFREMIDSLGDSNYLSLMLGLFTISIAINSLVTFVPLYMKDQIGISVGTVVWLNIGTFVGGMVTSLIWGWAADRYGSKPIMLVGVYIFIFCPAICFLMPRHGIMSTLIALIINVLVGIATIAWNIGFLRYLYVSGVPVSKKNAYLALYYAVLCLGYGVGPLFGGAIIKACSNINNQFLFFTIDSYTLFFALVFTFFVAGFLLWNRVRSDGAMPVHKFIGMFFQGNIWLAISSLVKHRMAKNEKSRVIAIEQMGYANNPFNNKELIDALGDPSFNVRYEAITAIACCRPTEELIRSLTSTLSGNEPELSVHAAWAIGKLGDKRGIPALQESLETDYPLLRARSARALSLLEDRDSIDRIHHYFMTEMNAGLRIAYAQGLCRMRVTEAIDDMLEFLGSLEDKMLRGEMAMAIAYFAGDERRYMSLLKRVDDNYDAAVAHVLLVLKKKLIGLYGTKECYAAIAQKCSEFFACGDAEDGVSALVELINNLRVKGISEPLRKILSDCSVRLSEFGNARREYVVLSIFVLDTVIRNKVPGNVVNGVIVTPER